METQDPNDPAYKARHMKELGEALANRNRHGHTIEIADFASIGLDRILVRPTVFNPAESFGGKFAALSLPGLQALYQGKTVLDMGSGTGVLGIVMARNRARSITFTDVNPKAVQNSVDNATNYGVVHEALESDLFDGLDDRRFDVIVANLPGATGEPRDLVETSIFSPDDMLESFLATAGNHLNESGIVIMPTSTSHTDTRRPDIRARKFGLNSEIVLEHHREPGVTQMMVVLSR